MKQDTENKAAEAVRSSDWLADEVERLHRDEWRPGERDPAKSTDFTVWVCVHLTTGKMEFSTDQILTDPDDEQLRRPLCEGWAWRPFTLSPKQNSEVK